MKPFVSVVVCTYERPRNLRMSLTSLLGQRGVEGQMEVIVADDGSRDETPSIVESFRRRADFPILFTTHSHQGFCPGRSRNEGAAASSGDYLIFLDGDCMVPPDHVALHLKHRLPGVARLGACAWINKEMSERVTEEMAKTGGYLPLTPAAEGRRLYQRAWKDWYYNLVRSHNRPSLVSNNFSLHRCDYERINGFDENFVGWGNEDDDFGRRLRRAGVQLRSILFWTCAYHLWHPSAPSFPATLEQGVNIPYARRTFRLTRCGNGIKKRSWRDLSYNFRGEFSERSLQAIVPDAHGLRTAPSGKAEVEVLFAPTAAQFTGTADCNVLVVPENTGETLKQVRRAHLIVCPSAQAASLSERIEPARLFGTDEFPLAMHYLLFNEREPRRIARAA